MIGGGPAGIMAAGQAAKKGAHVILLEKNTDIGEKILLTGKGRCNFTHYELDINRFAEKFGRKGRFLYGALNQFGVSDVIDFFHYYHLESKVERGKRVFPQEGGANTVLNALKQFLQQKKVQIRCSSNVIALQKTRGDRPGFRIILPERTIEADKVILCSGGKSYPQTGSTGEAFNWIKHFGHTLVVPMPALVPVCVSEKWVDKLKNLSLRNVKLQLYQDNKKKDERFGEMMFTHFGISGPIVMDMSKHIGQLLGKGKVKVYLDLKPALNFKQLDQRILRDFHYFKGKMFKNALKKLCPSDMIGVIVALSRIEPQKKVDYISSSERNRLLHLLKEMPLTPYKLLGYRWSMVTAGGISLNEVNPNTMASKKVKNLFFAGEILDLDGPSGGYNLQSCWSTAYVAGLSAALDV